MIKTTLHKGALCGAVLGTAVLLATSSSTNSGICSLSGDCGQVQASRFGAVLGLPVGWLGLAAYLSALLLACAPTSARRASASQAVRTVIVVAALWFFFVQIALLGQVCVSCCLVHTLACLGVWLWARADADEAVGSASQWGLGHAAAVMSVGVLAAVQWLQPEAAKTPATIAAASVAPVEASAAGTLSLYGGKHLLREADFAVMAPSAGSSAERDGKVIIYFGDYECPHCGPVKSDLKRWVSSEHAQARIVVVPVWRRDQGKELARVMMTMREENLEQYQSLEDRMSTHEIGPVMEQLRPAVISMLGSEEKLQALIAKHAIVVDAKMAAADAIFASNNEVLGGDSGKVPQLLIGNEIYLGSLPSESKVAGALLAAADAPIKSGSTASGASGARRNAIPAAPPTLAQMSQDPAKYPPLKLGTITVLKPVQRFKDLKPGETIAVTFPIRNDGSAKQLIGQVSCPAGVALVKAPAEELLQGATTEATVELTSPESLGHFSRFVTINTTSTDPAERPQRGMVVIEGLVTKSGTTTPASTAAPTAANANTNVIAHGQ